MVDGKRYIAHCFRLRKPECEVQGSVVCSFGLLSCPTGGEAERVHCWMGLIPVGIMLLGPQVCSFSRLCFFWRNRHLLCSNKLCNSGWAWLVFPLIFILISEGHLASTALLDFIPGLYAQLKAWLCPVGGDGLLSNFWAGGRKQLLLRLLVRPRKWKWNSFSLQTFYCGRRQGQAGIRGN